jgi:carbonic anhydrase
MMSLTKAWKNFALSAIMTAVALASILMWRAKVELETSDLVPLVISDAPTALAALRDGNSRFMRSARVLSIDTGHDDELRHLTAKEQHPIAVVLCCSDSRVCPELIFDQRNGSLFEVRNAGNVVDEDVLASCEYAVEHLHVPLLLVLGHKGCGAIKAVYQAHGKPLHHHLDELQKHMPGIEADVVGTHEAARPEVLDRLSEKNAKEQALSVLRQSSIVRSAVDAGHCQVLYGMYDMDTGAVDYHSLN